MKHSIYTFVLLCLTGLLINCNQDTPSRIVYEMSFEEIAQLAAAENKGFAIVLADPNCPPCHVLHQALFDDIAIAVGRKAIFNIVNVTRSQNRWYQQLILSRGQPTTLLFSPEAELKAIIPGANRVATECIKNVFAGELNCAQFSNTLLFPPSIQSEDAIRALSLILTARRKIENGEDATAELQKSMQTLFYPFQLWLMIQNEQNAGNQESAIMYARQMSTFREPWHIDLYSDLLLAARFVIDPDFNPDNMPRLEMDTEEVHLGILQLNETADFRVNLRNAGKEALVLHDINVGCSCLTLLNTARLEKEPDETSYLHLQFTAEQQGEILRTVIITNNSLEPMRSINVRAVVM